MVIERVSTTCLKQSAVGSAGLIIVQAAGIELAGAAMVLRVGVGRGARKSTLVETAISEDPDGLHGVMELPSDPKAFVFWQWQDGLSGYLKAKAAAGKVPDPGSLPSNPDIEDFFQ